MTTKSTPNTGRAASNAVAFRQRLQEACEAERAGQSYGAIGALLRKTLPEMRKEAQASSDRGDKIAGRLAASIDEIIKGLFSLAPIANENEFAICAIGGYGRRELAPFSDIDLLFLHRDADDATIRPLMDYMLYPLWDSGLKIGHGVHAPKSAVEFAKEDMIARTAYLDARYLCGSKKLFGEFQHQYDKLRRRTKNQFVKAKLDEQAERQTKAGETRYLVEPDIKEGKGALRDLQTIHWLYKYVFGVGAAVDKIVTPAEKRALAKSARFFWSVRFHLHDLRGRADEMLTFDIQPQIAERLGYADRPGMTAAERLMKHYFVTAVEVGRLTRILCARLEEERTKRLPHLPKMLPKSLQTDEAPRKPNLRIRNGRLDFDSAAKARRQPRDFFRLYRAFSKHAKIDFHPNALALVSELAPKVTSDIRKDPVVAQLFLGVLTRAPNPERVLRLMTETGLLGKYIPAFGAIVGRIDYGLYRRFTLDEHVLRCVGLLAKIHRGEHAEDHPYATQIMKDADNSAVFYLAVLLHEAVWTVKDRSISDCEKLVMRVARRLGLNEDDAALIGWGAARHMLLVRTAERRNLTDVRAVSTFAEEVADNRRLDLMLVLSVCYLRIVGVHSWDETTRRHFTDLYEATAIYLDKGEDALRARLNARASATTKETKRRLKDWSAEEKEQYLGQLTNHILRSTSAEILVRFAHLSRAAAKDDASAAVKVTSHDGDLEALVYADDRSGLLADIAGAIAACGLSVRAVQVLTSKDGKALDIFTIQSADGEPIDDQDQRRRLHAALLAAARKPLTKPPNLKRRMGDRRDIFTVAPIVRIELDASEDATVVEAEGLDRPGLLYGLAAALTEMDVMIASAHIATYGERAVDAFYLQDGDHRKITDPKTLKKIEKKLLGVLSAGSPR